MQNLDKLEELLQKRRLLLGQQETAQHIWDVAAERMNEAGADLLEIKGQLTAVLAQIAFETGPQVRVPHGFRYFPHLWMLPRPRFVYSDNL